LADFGYILTAYGLVAIPGALMSLLLWISRLGPRFRLLPIQRIVPCPWTGPEVVFAFLSLSIVPSVCHEFLKNSGFFSRYYGVPTPDQESIWAQILAAPLLVAWILVFVYYASGTRPKDLGLSLSRWRQNVVLGYLAWLLATPLVYGVHVVALQFFDSKPHKIEDLLRNAGVLETILIVGEAIIWAPFLEELIFRGLLLGWLRQASALGHTVVAAFALLLSSRDLAFALGAKDMESLDLDPFLFVLALAVGYMILVWRFPMASKVGAQSAASRPNRPWASLVGSSLLFASVHADWPAPISLFLLALVLGWLKLRTNNLLTTILLHALFNTVACLGVLLNV
jgi:membrane protease YdiL (CAAX protease family)